MKNILTLWRLLWIGYHMEIVVEWVHGETKAQWVPGEIKVMGNEFMEKLLTGFPVSAKFYTKNPSYYEIIWITELESFFYYF